MNNKQKTDMNMYTTEALKAGVPNHLVSGLALYVVMGIRPGGFMTAVLENDLKGAIACADANSYAGLKELVQFLYNSVPASCYGTPEKVEKWGGVYANR